MLLATTVRRVMPTLVSRRHGSGFVVFAYRDRARPLPLGYWENYVKTKEHAYW